MGPRFRPQSEHQHRDFDRVVRAAAARLDWRVSPDALVEAWTDWAMHMPGARHWTMAALDVITTPVPGQQVHAVGSCLGGAILPIAASTMASDGHVWLASITLMAAQVDLSEAGELWPAAGLSDTRLS